MTNKSMIMSVSLRLMFPYSACMTVFLRSATGVHPVGCSWTLPRQSLHGLALVPTCKNYLPLIAACLSVDNSVIKPAAVVRDLGVLLDSELTMKQHVNQVARNCFYQLRRLRQIRRYAGQDVAMQLVSALILSRLDYCNSGLAGLPKSTLAGYTTACPECCSPADSWTVTMWSYQWRITSVALVASRSSNKVQVVRTDAHCTYQPVSKVFDRMFLSQLQSKISDQACVPHLPATTLFLVSNQDWASGHFPMPGHLRGTVYQLTFRTYPTPQVLRNA